MVPALLTAMESAFGAYYGYQDAMMDAFAHAA